MRNKIIKSINSAYKKLHYDYCENPKSFSKKECNSALVAKIIDNIDGGEQNYNCIITSSEVLSIIEESPLYQQQKNDDNDCLVKTGNIQKTGVYIDNYLPPSLIIFLNENNLKDEGDTFPCDVIDVENIQLIWVDK